MTTVSAVTLFKRKLTKVIEYEGLRIKGAISVGVYLNSRVAVDLVVEKNQLKGHMYRSMMKIFNSPEILLYTKNGWGASMKMTPLKDSYAFSATDFFKKGGGF